MSGTAQAEIAAILTQMATAGDVRYGVRDDETPTVDWSGAPVGYMVPKFLPPVPAARGRSLGVSEKGQPQVFPFQVTCIGPTDAAVNELRIECDGALIGWSPDENNATEIKGVGSRVPPSLDTNSTPSEVRLIRYFECRIGAEVDELH